MESICRGMLCQVVSARENNLADRSVTSARPCVESYPTSCNRLNAGLPREVLNFHKLTVNFRLGATLTPPGASIMSRVLKGKLCKEKWKRISLLLHLGSRGWATFRAIRHLVGWDVWKRSEAQRIIAPCKS